MIKNQKGITLIALVITIIVLLILAGVSIAMLTGDNGILTNASKAQIETDKKNAIDKVNIALQAIKTEALAKQNEDVTFNPKTSIDDLQELTTSTITGISSSDTGYTINDDTAGIIRINYVNTATGVDIGGKIEFVKGTNGIVGEITEATEPE